MLASVLFFLVQVGLRHGAVTLCIAFNGYAGKQREGSTFFSEGHSKAIGYSFRFSAVNFQNPTRFMNSLDQRRRTLEASLCLLQNLNDFLTKNLGLGRFQGPRGALPEKGIA